MAAREALDETKELRERVRELEARLDRRRSPSGRLKLFLFGAVKAAVFAGAMMFVLAWTLPLESVGLVIGYFALALLFLHQEVEHAGAPTSPIDISSETEGA